MIIECYNTSLVNKKMYQSIKKQLVFSKNLIEIAEKRANKFGITFGEYLKMLIVNDSKEDIDYSLRVTSDENYQVKESLSEYQSGNYKSLKNKKDIKKFMQSL